MEVFGLNNSNTKRKRGVIYRRVSTGEQAVEGYSLDAQEKACREYASKNGYEIVKVYSDEGISGKSIKNRPAFRQMLTDAKSGLFDLVIIWKLTRIARNMLDTLYASNHLEKHNVGLYSISEQFDLTTSSGRMMMQLLASFAEFEREGIASNVAMSMEALVRDKKRPAGGRRIGYVSGTNSDGLKELIIDPEEAKLVQLIYQKYLAGNGYRAIANSLNRQGFKTVKGNAFSTTAVKDILHNYQTYNGYHVYGRYKEWEKKRRKGKNPNPVIVKGTHEKIIDDETAKKVAKRLELESFQPKWNNQGANLLTGLLRCPQCGATMAANNTTNTMKDGTKKRIRYYSCSRFRNQGSSVCHANSIRADFAEEFVADRLKEIVQVPEILKSLVKDLNEEIRQQIKPLEQELAYIASNRGDIEENIQKWQDLLLDNPELKDDLLSRIENLQEERKLIIKRENEILGILSNKDRVVKASEIHKIVAAVDRMLTDQPKKVIKEIYKTFIEKIEFNPLDNYSIQITMKFSENIVAQLNEVYNETVSNKKDAVSFVYKHSDAVTV